MSVLYISHVCISKMSSYSVSAIGHMTPDHILLGQLSSKG